MRKRKFGDFRIFPKLNCEQKIWLIFIIISFDTSEFSIYRIMVEIKLT